MSAGALGLTSKAVALWLLFFAALTILHISVLDLPFFWDELGQFIPAALDIYEHGWWVPRSTLPNVHPPGVMAYLAAVWQVTGYSIVTTRLAMLALAAAGLVGTYRLASMLGAPAWYPALFLLASPLFWAQSMMAQLDMPAMVLTVWALVLFFREQHWRCALLCTCLVLVKESSLVVPATFGATLLWRRRWSHAIRYFLPAAATAAWLGVLKSTTGHLLGNQEFTHYNVWFQFHPVRLPLTLLRRVYYVLFDNFHWIATATIVFVWRRRRFGEGQRWATVAWIFVLQTLGVTVLGGAALERYVLPVLPLFYIAASAALACLRPSARTVVSASFVAGLTVANFVPSPFPYPFENNSAFVDFVRLQEGAARHIQRNFPHATVASAWPFPDALRRPEFGYVDHPVKQIGLDNFHPEVVGRRIDEADVLVLYSRTWEPSWGVLRSRWVFRLLSDYYYYKPQITADQLATLGFHPVKRMNRGEQWIEIYTRRTSFP